MINKSTTINHKKEKETSINERGVNMFTQLSLYIFILAEIN